LRGGRGTGYRGAHKKESPAQKGVEGAWVKKLGCRRERKTGGPGGRPEGGQILTGGKRALKIGRHKRECNKK